MEKVAMNREAREQPALPLETLADPGFLSIFLQAVTMSQAMKATATTAANPGPEAKGKGAPPTGPALGSGPAPAPASGPLPSTKAGELPPGSFKVRGWIPPPISPLPPPLFAPPPSHLLFCFSIFTIFPSPTLSFLSFLFLLRGFLPHLLHCPPFLSRGKCAPVVLGSQGAWPHPGRQGPLWTPAGWVRSAPALAERPSESRHTKKVFSERKWASSAA